jgi:hypothetical protein
MEMKNLVFHMENEMYASMKSLREKESTKRVGTTWLIEEDESLIQELREKKSIAEIASSHQRTARGIILRRNSLICADKDKSVNEEEICNKFNISQCEYYLIINERNVKQGKKTKEEIQEERIVKLENEVRTMNQTLVEIRDYLKVLTLSQHVNINSSNPFDT